MLLAGRLNHLLSEVQHLEDQVASDVVVFQIMDCSAQPLIYNTATDDENLALTVSELLDSCRQQLTGDVNSQQKTKKSYSSDNRQVCSLFCCCMNSN